MPLILRPTVRDATAFPYWMWIVPPGLSPSVSAVRSATQTPLPGTLLTRVTCPRASDRDTSSTVALPRFELATIGAADSRVKTGCWSPSSCWSRTTTARRRSSCRIMVLAVSGPSAIPLISSRLRAD